MKIIKSLSATRPFVKSPYPQDKRSYAYDWEHEVFVSESGEEVDHSNSEGLSGAKSILVAVKKYKLVGSYKDDMVDSAKKIVDFINAGTGDSDATLLLSPDDKYVLGMLVQSDDGIALLVPAKWKNIDWKDYSYKG